KGDTSAERASSPEPDASEPARRAGEAPARAGSAGGAPGADGDAVAGIERAAVERFFAAHVPGALPPLRFTLIGGGRSNLTYRVEDARGGRWVLRRPPLGH